MNILCGSIIGALLLLTIVIVSARAVNASNYAITSANGIDETVSITVNGITQPLHIRGDNTANPIMIFLHGGPGSPMGFAAPYFQRPIEKQFTVIHYDQRGCGRTRFANPRHSHDITTAQLEADLDAIVDYARERFDSRKVVIIGHSWGSILGMRYVRSHQEKILAYIGVSQGVSGLYRGKITLGESALAVAEQRNKGAARKLSAALQRMKAVDNGDTIALGDLMTVNTLCSRYLSAKGEMPSAAQIWTGITSPYMTCTDLRWFLSMSNTKAFFASQKDLIQEAFFDFDLNVLGTQWDVPMYFIVGSHDCMIPQEPTIAYYETVSAPHKALVTMSDSGHSPFMDHPEEFAETVLGFFSEMK